MEFYYSKLFIEINSYRNKILKSFDLQIIFLYFCFIFSVFTSFIGKDIMKSI